MSNLLNRLFGGYNQAMYGVFPEYGVPTPEYGVPAPTNAWEVFIGILRFAFLPIIIAIVLAVGLYAILKRTALSAAKITWIIIVSITIFLGIYIPLAIKFNWF